MDRNRGLDINALRQQLEDLFEDFFPAAGSRRPPGGRGDQAQHLQVNLVESEDAFVLTAPLPGFLPEDIEINVRGQNLNLRAQRKNPPGDRPNFLRREWGFGPFHRSLDLPGNVDAERASASFKLGVVTITIPKGERAKNIPVEEQEAAEEVQATEPVETAGQETGTEVHVTESPVEVPTSTPEATADTESDADAARGGRSFYMRPAQGGRRGRSGQRGGPRPVAASVEAEAEPTPSEADEAPNDGLFQDSMPQELSDMGSFGGGAQPSEDESDTAPDGIEPEGEALAAVGEDPERPQEPGAETASPVAHTTTASDDVWNLSDQHGPSTDTDAEPSEPAGNDVSDDQDAERSQTSNEPTD